MRLHSQTAKIEGGFVLFPKQAHWLDAYLLELVTFPNAKTDDQVDSTVYALAWMTLNLPTCIWNDTALQGFSRFTEAMAFNARFR